MTSGTPPPESVSEDRSLSVGDHLRRFTGFALLPACSLLASVTLLPLISQTQGRAGWVALGVGQGIGAIVGVIAGLAWPTIGGNAVAKAAEKDRPGIFVSSVYSRLLALAVLLPISVLVCLLLVEDYRMATTLFMAGTALNAMTASWYYSGTGAPSRLVINEGVVRLAGYAVSAAALALGAPLAAYGAMTVLAGLVSLALNWTHIVGFTLARTTGLFKDTLSTLSEHKLGASSRVLLSVFGYGGTPIYTAISPASAATFAALDQLQRATLNATGVFPQTFVSWVCGDMTHFKRRSTIALAFMTGASAVILLGWTVLGPLIVDLLFSGEAEITRVGCFLVGLNVATALLCATYQLLVMIPLDMHDLVFKLGSVGAVIGVVVLAVLSTTQNVYLAFSTWSIMNGASLPIPDVSGEAQEPCGELTLEPNHLSRLRKKDTSTMQTVCSFDVFDTVLTRRVGAPEAVFPVVAEQLRREHAISTTAEVFAELRKSYERRLIASSGRQVGLRTIYTEMARSLAEEPSRADYLGRS